MTRRRGRDGTTSSQRQRRGLLTALVVACLLSALACEAPSEVAARRPGPVSPPEGAWHELQSALVARDESWVRSHLAAASIPPAMGERDSRLAELLIERLAPLLYHALVVTETGQAWHRFDATGQYVGANATVLVTLRELDRYSHGEELIEWTRALAGDDARPAHAQRYFVHTYWTEERAHWRLRHLVLIGPGDDDVWVLPTQGWSRVPRPVPRDIDDEDADDSPEATPAVESPAGP